MWGRALESILISVSTALDVEMAVLRKFVNELLTQLEEDIDRERLRNMLVYSKKLSAFEKKASLTRDAVAEILDNGTAPLVVSPKRVAVAYDGRRGPGRDVLDGKVEGETTGCGST
jgi:hypothetical protein